MQDQCTPACCLKKSANLFVVCLWSGHLCSDPTLKLTAPIYLVALSRRGLPRLHFVQAARCISPWVLVVFYYIHFIPVLYLCLYLVISSPFFAGIHRGSFSDFQSEAKFGSHTIKLGRCRCWVLLVWGCNWSICLVGCNSLTRRLTMLVWLFFLSLFPFHGRIRLVVLSRYIRFHIACLFCLSSFFPFVCLTLFCFFVVYWKPCGFAVIVQF